MYICLVYYEVFLEFIGVKEFFDEWKKESGKIGGVLLRFLIVLL